MCLTLTQKIPRQNLLLLSEQGKVDNLLQLDPQKQIHNYQITESVSSAAFSKITDLHGNRITGETILD